jgi:putative ABC transport system permease protein
MLRDFRQACRRLRKSPVAAIVAILALALGIGANVSCFTAVNAVLLRPFAYPNLERIVTVWERVPKVRSDFEGIAPANFLDWRDQANSFEEFAAYRRWNANLTGSDHPLRLDAARVMPGFFRALGIKPALGEDISRQ